MTTASLLRQWTQEVFYNYVAITVHSLHSLLLLFPIIPGYRIRWLMESYLGLKHVPFEHFACSSTCASVLNKRFQTIQARLKQQHDNEYKSMLERYSDLEPGNRSQILQNAKSLEVQELWSPDFNQSSLPPAGRTSAWGLRHRSRSSFTEHCNRSRLSMWATRRQYRISYTPHNRRTSCAVM